MYTVPSRLYSGGGDCCVDKVGPVKVESSSPDECRERNENVGNGMKCIVPHPPLRGDGGEVRALN